MCARPHHELSFLKPDGLLTCLCSSMLSRFIRLGTQSQKTSLMSALTDVYVLYVKRCVKVEGMHMVTKQEGGNKGGGGECFGFE